jgi:hypothetical protein
VPFGPIAARDGRRPHRLSTRLKTPLSFAEGSAPAANSFTQPAPAGLIEEKAAKGVARALISPILDENACRQCLRRVVVEHGHGRLHDDRSAVELRGDGRRKSREQFQTVLPHYSESCGDFLGCIRGAGSMFLRILRSHSAAVNVEGAVAFCPVFVDASRQSAIPWYGSGGPPKAGVARSTRAGRTNIRVSCNRTSASRTTLSRK